MKNYLCSAALVAGLALFAGAFAQVPVGSTGLCKDGSYSSAESKKGACAKHGGVKEWYATGATSEKAAAPATAEGTKSTAAAPTRPGTASQTTSPVAGGGPGQVWVNTRSKVYHCQGDKWYGKTMKGAYMTEEAAKAAGSHADHSKAYLT